MGKEETIVVSGIVTEVLPNTMFRIQLDETQNIITGYLSGKLRQNKIKVIMGDSVEVEISTYDLSKGRVVFRNK